MKNLKVFVFLTLFVLSIGTISAQEEKNAEKTADEGQQTAAEQKPADAEQPAAEQKPAEGEQPAAEQKPAEGEQPAAEQKPAEGEQPATEQKPAEQQPAAEQKPAEQQPAAEQKPAEQQPAAEQKPAEQQPAAEQKPVEQQPAAEQKPVEEKPVAEQKPVEEEKAADEKTKEEQKTADSKEDKKAEPENKKDDNDRRIREIEKRFWKGEIANIGANEIISPYNSAGLSAGVKLLNDELADSGLYLVINPKFSMNFEKLIKEPISEKELDLFFGLHAPLNIRLLSTDINTKDRSVRFRTEDWDEWQDYLKILRYLQIGTSEDNLYLSVGSNLAQTIGHGTILKRYIPNHDSTFSTMSAKLNWYFDYAGFEALLGDVARGNIFGGLVFVKPFSALGGYHARSISFGYSFVADRNAPTKLKYEKYYDYDPDDFFSGKDKRIPRISVDSKGRPIIEDDEFLYIQGIDLEAKLYKNEKVDIKVFTDYSWFKTDFVKGGFTFGVLGRFNLDEKNQHAIRVQLEGRAHHDSYLPSFFDTFYDVERIEMMTNIYGKSNFQPDGRSKYWHLMNDSDDKFVGSFYGEISYSWRTWIAISLGYEQLPDSASLFAHLELPDLWIVKTMLSYYKRGFGSAKELFSDDRVSSMFRAIVRFQILPVLYVNGYAGKRWSFWNAGSPRENDNLEGHYISSWDLGADIEFGWEWGRTGAEKKDNKSKDKKPEKK